MTIDIHVSGAEAGRPKYLAIADAIEAVVMGGRAAPDDPLPTQRELAGRLGVTVGTVTRGYARRPGGAWCAARQGAAPSSCPNRDRGARASPP